MAIGSTNAGGIGGQGVAPQPISNIVILNGNKKATLKWTDPQDTIIDGKTICVWSGTKVVANTDHYPTKPNDGILWIDNKVRNQYQTTGFEKTGLINNTTYYLSFFPYSNKKVVNTNLEGQVAKAMPFPYSIWTVKIDQNNSNSETCCTYADDAIGMTPKSDEWDKLFNMKPCLFKDGLVVGYLNPNDFTKFVDGTSADITSGNAGDVMIEFPRMGLNISTDANDVITVSMTNNPNSSEFSYLAHTRGNVNKDYFYMGAYDGYYDGSKLRSLSGKYPVVSQTIGTFRTYAHNNGIGYEQQLFYQTLFIQCLYLLKYKNLNSQEALGMGCVDVGSAQTSGYNNTNGMCYGTTSKLVPMKLFGIENFWGNIYKWLDGICTDVNYNILTATDNFNDSGSGYNSYSSGTASVSGYMVKAQGSTEKGFVLKSSSGGSSSTYYSDFAALNSSRVCYFGGYWIDSLIAGAFALYLSVSASYAFASIGARLMYL